MAERRMLPPEGHEFPDLPPKVPTHPPLPPRPIPKPVPPRPRQPPVVVYWSRIEPQPLTSNLQPGLQARLADPLWLTSRQWQFAELEGEDAGSPIELRLEGETAPVTRFVAGPIVPGVTPKPVDFAGLGLPLEPAVEREAVRPHDRLSAEAGLHFLRLLAREGAGALRPAYVTQYAMAPRSGVPDGQDPSGADRLRLYARRAPDGVRLAADLAPLAAADGTLGSLPAAPVVPEADRPAVLRAATAWLAYYRAQVSEPARNAASSWIPERQEYAFALGAKLTPGPVTLAADEYTDGRLDWYSFRVASAPDLGGRPPKPTPLAESLLPTPARYPGMPSDRLWAFEDGRVNLGGLEAGPTDLTRLLLAEFALVYGNDWFTAPIDLPVGSVTRFGTVTVRDTFGVVTTVRPSRDLSSTRWSMFHLPAPDDGSYLADVFFLAPTLPTPLETGPLEELALFRDEQANLAWGVERIVQGPSGEPVDRAREASQQTVRQTVVGDIGDARVLYRLMTTVPEYWFPLVPVATARPAPDQPVMAFERRTMLRVRPDGRTEEVQPRGRLLRANLAVPPVRDPLQIAEEELARSGAVVTRSFQYARDPTGVGVLWVGRSKRTGRGEGASGLRYDVAEPPTPADARGNRGTVPPGQAK